MCSTNDERQLKAVMEFRKAYSAQALEGSNIPKVIQLSINETTSMSIK